MKKMTSALLLVGLTVSVAEAAPSHVRRDGANGYNVTYNYTDKEKNGWYGTIRAQLNFLNWKNTYYSDDVGYKGEDKYSFEPVFGGSLAVGKKFGYFWRGELELGYGGQFSDSGQGFEFKFSTPYALVNAYYDFNSGLYLGGGLGAAMPMQKLSWSGFKDGDLDKMGFSPMAGLMFGYTHKLDDSFVIDLRYRIAGWNGIKDSGIFVEDVAPYAEHYLETKIGLVLENSVSVGLRYEF
ncbi:MAG: hypothetical protein LBF37_02480 [Rickettsiales bacterium]|jgi:hypothetical protein|nr:hypothetical protein [Rickettsiales bacterium]